MGELLLFDPLREGAPDAWDAFVEEHKLPSAWASGMLGRAAWCSPNAILMGAFCTGSGAAVALFHGRLIGLPGRPDRYRDPQVRPLTAILECKLTPGSTSTGYEFAPGLSAGEKSAAVRAFNGGVRRRLGGRLAGIVYRHVHATDLAGIAGKPKLSLPVQPTAVLDNHWDDVTGYLAGLESAHRKGLRRIRRRVDEDAGLTVGIEQQISAHDAARLAALVRARHRGPFAEPPLSVGYMDALGNAADTSFMTYRENDGRLIAFSVVHDNGAVLVHGHWGLEELVLGGRRDLFFDVNLRVVERMIHTGRRRLVLGKAMPKLKAMFGARMEPQFAVFGLR